MRVSNLAFLLVPLALVACGPGATKILGDRPKDAAAAESPPGRTPFEGCAWEHFTGRGIRVWSQVCKTGQRETRLAMDPAIDGVWLTTTFVGLPPERRRLAFRTFGKEPDQAPEALISTLLAAGAAPAEAHCALAPKEGAPPEGRQRFVLTPIADTKEAWLAAHAADPPVVTPLPCGAYGVALVGDRYFELDPAHPDRLVFVELGSELQICEPDTLELVAE